MTPATPAAALQELLSRLAALDVRLTLDGERLGVSAPKGVLTPALRAELAERKEALKTALREQAAATRPPPAAAPDAAAAPAWPGAGAPGPLPLSHAQQRLWFLRQMAPSSPVYNLAISFELRGPLNGDALRQALDELQRRHDSLRARFVEAEGAPQCLLVPPAGAPLQRLDLAELPGDRRRAAGIEALTREAGRLFQLEQAPLWRATLVRLADDHHLVGWVFDHIIADGLSVAIFLHELQRLYALAAGGASPEALRVALPALPAQYADCVRWQREAVESGGFDGHLRYWKDKLRGLPPVLALPTDRPRPPVQTNRGARLVQVYPPALAGELKALARREGVTLYMVLLAALQALVHRHSGETDFAIGTAVGARHRAEEEGVFGFFANNIVQRADLEGEPSVRELLARVRETAHKAYAHQDIPFDLLVEALAPRRDLDHTPLFQVLFVLHTLRIEQLQLGAAAGASFELESRTARFDLALDIFDLPTGLHAYFEFNTDLFDAGTIARLADQYRHVLQGMIADPGARVASLPLVDGPQIDALLQAWRGPRLAAPAGPTVHALFERQARRSPRAQAVRFEEQSLTYRELDEQASALASRLREFGVQPGSFVGIWMERSLHLPVSLLAVLKAGGAYVPLDPAFPADRIEFMMGDAGLALVLTQQGFAGRLAGGGPRCLCVDAVAGDESSATGTGAPSTAAPAPAGAGDLAYMLYTSGSTGRPKGVMIEHGAVVNFLRSMQAEPGIGAHDRLVCVTTMSFDIFGLELWGPLTAGGTVVLAGRATAVDGEALAALLEREQATILQATPATWRVLLESGWPGRPGLKMLCGGEALPRDLAARLLATGGELWNMYGPTETTIWSTVSRIHDAAEPITIGRPIAETSIVVLEPHGVPAPPGVAGELCIGGAGVARGYHARPELTAEKFVMLSLGRQGPQRFYRTGDLARLRGDGRLEFIGRRDHQVKLRGFRIELGEVEAAVAQVAGVRQNVAVVREDRPGDQRLVAYVVCQPGPAFDSEAARTALRRTLPEYMVPNQFVVLERLPLTPNNKVDRKSLPVPGQPDAGSQGGGDKDEDAPLGAVEMGVADVWRQLLDAPRIRADDNFFDLGGHSLLLVRLQARLRRAFGVTLPLVGMFRDPTVRGLARALRSLGVSGAAVPEAVPVARDGPLPLSHTQQRLWFLKQLDPHNTAYHVYAPIRFTGQLDEVLVERCVDELVQRHESLRTRFVSHEGTPAACIEASARVTFERVDLRAVEDAAQREDAMKRQVEAFVARPFELTLAPLMRGLWVRLAGDCVVLCLCVDHLVADGLSMGLLADELRQLYTLRRQGQSAGLEPLRLQYADLAAWQQRVLDAGAIASHRDYWHRQLAGLPPLLPLPTDRPRPALQSTHGARVTRPLAADLPARVRALARSTRSTSFMVLLGAFMALLQRYTGRDDIPVGTAVGHRSHPDAERVVGFFANNIVLRGDLSGEPTVEELLTRVRETCLAGMAHQEMPFDQLVDDLVKVRATDHSPLFQVLFVLQALAQPTLDLPGARGEPFTLDRGAARFDLALDVLESPTSLTLLFEFNTDLFDSATIERLALHYEALLRDLLARPQARLSQLRMLDDDTLQHLLALGRGPAGAPPVAASVHALFERRARQSADAVAVRSGGQSLTYRELDERAGRLAAAVRASGAAAGGLVGIWLERSLDLPAAWLGVLKAGAACVPLEPDLPPARVGELIADAGLTLVVTCGALATTLPAGPPRFLCTDDPASWPAGDPAHLPSHAPTDLAMVAYTSGPHGRPLGVMVEHQALASRLGALGHEPGLGAGETLLALPGASAGVSAVELLAPLLGGGTLVLGSAADALDGQALTQTIAAEAVTLVQATPCTLGRLLRSGWIARPGLKVLSVGDNLPQGVAAALLAAGAPLWNLYGTTETGPWSLAARVTAADAPVPIGRPLGDTLAVVLDASGQVAPPGVPGELFVGGASLARGYLNQPDLTARRFVTIDLPGSAGQRLHRTGDLARLRPGGEFEFIGRRDLRVKVQGARVELAEIESALAALPGVAEAAACLESGDEGGEAADRRLVAYLVPGPGGTFDEAAIRAALAARLPRHMVPASFVTLAAMPTTAGALDRQALAPWAAKHRALPIGAPPEVIAGPVEARVASAWREVLGVTRVGLHDNFFDLGGHSLLLVKLHARLQREFCIEVPLVELFQHTTVQGQAARVERAIGPRTGPGDGAPGTQALTRARARAEKLQQSLQP